MSKSLQDLIAGTSELRSLPSTTMRLMSLLDDATVGAEEVLDVIEKDPSLTANLLKLSNSAYYGLRCQVGSAREALVMLGNQTIVNLAFATSMGDILRGPLAGYHLERNELWFHALGTAIGASQLASLASDTGLRERAFTGGLVHDIGKLLLNRSLKENLVQLPPQADFQTLLAAETDILGFDHTEAGAALGAAWNFPSSLVQLIGAHHLPGRNNELSGPKNGGAGSGGDVWQDMDEEVRTLVRAVAAANVISVFCGFGGGSAPVDRPELMEVMDQLGFDPELIEPLLISLPHDLDAMLSVIGESR